MENTFFHIRYIVLCDHFRDIGFTDCVMGMKDRVREENMRGNKDNNENYFTLKKQQKTKI